jgi:hypothetical protein
MMLGSATCRMEAGNWNSCALGAAANAVGLVRDFNFALFGERHESYARINEINATWPWLDIQHQVVLDEQPETPGHDIYHMFDRYVCTGKMTFEALVDYVRSIEPACGECNRFECTCKAATVAEQVVLETAEVV